MRAHVNKTVNSGLFVHWTVVLNREWQIVDFEIYLINIGRNRIRMDWELLPGSGSGTWKIQSWIRIWNKIIPDPQHWLRICRDLRQETELGFNLSPTDQV